MSRYVANRQKADDPIQIFETKNRPSGGEMNDTSQLVYIPDLIEAQARDQGDRTYIHFEEEKVSFKQFFERCCRVANGLIAQGGSPGDGLAILMGNCPAFLYLFYGLPMGGFYTVPINTGLRGDGLKFILSNSDVKYLVIDDTLYGKLETLGSPVETIEKIFVNRTTDQPLPKGTFDFRALLEGSPEKPAHRIEAGALNYLMYTSGTTGLPKGVVNRHQPGMALFFKMAGARIEAEKDILYTCLPLFHANALLLTAGFAMGAGATFGLDRRFSASRFWDRIRYYGATQFNGLGAMIPILMKQPEKPDDSDNPVKQVNSAACPANLWRAFEERFDVDIHEGYGAVDGGGVTIGNSGDAPVGSVGKPGPNLVWKLVDDDGNDVPVGEPGELITQIPEGQTSSVEYYKNPEASKAKIRDGWLHSGDLFYADKEDNLYFVDRKTDSMRRRGENISSWEVENIVEKYPGVAVCAAFGVPSELGEDEVMIQIVPKEGQTVDLKDLIRFCAENMAHFMVPRFVDVVEDIPRTGTLRIQKTQMKKQGVTDRTWDREKEMPDFQLKKI